jgi:hypothetical protein
MKVDCLGKGEKRFVCVMHGGDPLKKVTQVIL